MGKMMINKNDQQQHHHHRIMIQFRVAKALSTSSAKRTIPSQLLRDTRAGERLKVDPNQQ